MYRLLLACGGDRGIVAQPATRDGIMCAHEADELSILRAVAKLNFIYIRPNYEVQVPYASTVLGRRCRSASPKPHSILEGPNGS